MRPGRDEAMLLMVVMQVLGVELDKDKGISCSDWGQWPLSDRQVRRRPLLAVAGERRVQWGNRCCTGS